MLQNAVELLQRPLGQNFVRPREVRERAGQVPLGRVAVGDRERVAEVPVQLARNDEEAAKLPEVRDLIWQLGAAAHQVVQAGSQEQVTKAREVLSEARRSLYRILADDEPKQD